MIDEWDGLLLSAVSNLDLEGSIKALNSGANPNGIDPNESLLHSIAYDRNQNKYDETHLNRLLAIARKLLKSGADPNAVGYNNWRAIDVCIDNGFAELAELLIQYGADPIQREFT